MLKIKEISSVHHPLIKHIVKLKQDRHYRYTQQSVVIEGIKPIEELLGTSQIRVILVSSPDLIPPGEVHEYVYLVTDSIMKKISSMQTPEGIVAEFIMPPLSPFTGFKYVVAFDGINDPGNMGTLIRTALALGWDGAFILPDSCDPYNDKAIRAGRGAQFRLPLRFGDSDELNALCHENGLIPVVADLNGTPSFSIPFDKGCVLVLGNEARGPSAKIQSFCKPITIPMPGQMESLNVAIAGSILIYLLKNNKPIVM